MKTAFIWTLVNYYHSGLLLMSSNKRHVDDSGDGGLEQTYVSHVAMKTWPKFSSQQTICPSKGGALTKVVCH